MQNPSFRKRLERQLSGKVYRAYGAGRELPDPTRARRHLLHASRVAVDDVAATSPDPADFEAALCALGRGLGESDPA